MKASLHHHTTFSYLDGYGTPEEHFERASEVGLEAMALTEHGNVSSHVRGEQASQKTGVKALFGCELYCGEVGEAQHRKKNHLTVLAENEEGYKNLLRVVSRGWAEGFYYEPTVSGRMLADHKDGLLVLSGCTGSLLATSLVGGKNVDPEDASYARARHTARRFQDAFGDAYYLEVQVFPELDKTRAINAGLARLSLELGIPLVATLDAHYMKPDQSELQKVLHGCRPGKLRTAEDLERSWGYDVKLCPHLDDAELVRRLVATGLTKSQAQQALAVQGEIADRCNVVLPKVSNLVYPLPPGVGSNEELFRKWCNDGWTYRNMKSMMHLRDRDGRDPIERTKYEMRMIMDKGFTDYFLVVADAVKFAKDHGIPVGPARGSAAASLVCYLMRITEVNPLLFPTLLFERFIDINRHDLPDIDLDFDDERRHEVRDYLVAKYGEDRVGNIGTFVRYKGRNSLDDVAKVHRVPTWAVDQVKDLLIERASGDLRANATIEDTIEMFPQVKEVFDKYPALYKALDLEGNVRNMSVHAAGLVLANDPLTDVCAVYTKPDPKTGKPKVDKYGDIAQVVSLDKYDAEYLNVLKLDALGLKTMGMIRIALEQIGMTLEELYALPLDDQPTLQGFREGDVVGVFQFDGRAMRSVNAGVVPDNFMEVADVNALARPGPLHGGATAEYIDVKHGRKSPTHWHPIVDRITEHTNYQVVYQEQILQVVRELGGFSWEEAARIRKIISKKRGEQEFNRQRDRFVDGASREGMDADDAHRVFNMLATAGAYAFNAAHCVSYGLLAYWTMWLKRHHPQAFYSASLTKAGTDKKGKERVRQLLRDMLRHDIELLPIHMNKSGATWQADGDGVRPGFVQVPGIAEKTAAAILATRERLGRYSEWEDLAITRGIGPKKVDAIQEFFYDEDPFALSALTRRLADAVAFIDKGFTVETAQGDVARLPLPTHKSVEIPYERTDRNVEVVWLGVIKDRNLKDLFEAHFSRTGEQLDPSKTKDPHLNEWVVMLGEDDTDILTITIDRWRYQRWKEMVWEITPEEDLVLVRGIKRKAQSRRAVYVTEMWVLSFEDDKEEDEDEFE